uniref:Splicing factor 3B subunit 3 n=1 Tax=Papio anubis TaxID=9555 RepID=A0A8I5P1Y4_PAPAN
MFLYNLTLQRATGISFAIHGNFSGTKQQEIVVSRGKILELLRPDPNTGKVHTLLTVEVFGVIRSLMAFRLTGGTKDYIVVGSDSGRIVILEYQPSKNMFEKIHQETFGKSGCRRIVPGQFLAVDPKGRAVMISAIEKQKLVYILNRDAAARLTISSPLEAHKANTLVYHVVGVDVGFENPMFACLEMDYEEADNDPTGEAAANTQQTLTFYELDLGLNHVVRKYSEPLEEHGNFLITVPGGSDGPSGVLICSENYITYKNFGDQPDIRCPIPRRRNDLDDPERGMIFVCSATHKTKSMFFFLAQTEQGDIFKITLETDEDMVTEIRLKYFDTVPVAAAMCVLKTGFLFVASEFGNHYLYQIAHLGDDDEEPEFSSAMPLEEGDTFFFQPRPLKNLVLVDELDSLSPILFCQIADLANEDTPQLYVACGRGPRSSLRVLRHGLEVSEMAVSELPGNPNAVWTVRRHIEDEFDAYIIVSFVNATLVLSIGETVEEVTDSGFLGTTPTLSCSLLGDDALVQVYPDGIRHIRADKRVNEWKTPGKKTIVKCAVNQRQVVIALTGGELVYFEMDPSGQLNEYTERKEMSADVVCMSLANVPPGEQRSRFLAVGLVDNTVRIISLDPSDCLQPLSMQALPAQPESLCIVEMGGTEKQDELGERGSIGFLYLNIGLQNGVLLRTVLDPVTGDLSDTRTRYLGSRPVKLFRVRMQGQEAVLAMSSRSWLSYSYQSRFHLTPLSYETLEFASGFASEQCPEGIVAISTNTLRILALEKLGAVFNQVAFPLQYTPRKFVIHPESNNLIIIETDHNAYTEATKAQRKQQMAEHIANYISGIQTIGHRVIVSDVQESFIWVRYKRNENQLIIFADDTYPRWVTTASLLDYDTVAGADKFGNICVVRLPPNTNDEVDEDPTGNKALWDRGLLNGASQKAEVIMNYHVGETVLSLQKTTLIPGGSESLVYTTLSGGIGILVPFTSHEDHDFFQHVEMHLRSEHPPLCGRDHLSFRSYYFPVKNVIDGDLCEQFNSMEPNKQKNVSEELDRTPPEVSKKLEDIRTRYAF